LQTINTHSPKTRTLLLTYLPNDDPMHSWIVCHFSNDIYLEYLNKKVHIMAYSFHLAIVSDSGMKKMFITVKQKLMRELFKTYVFKIK